MSFNMHIAVLILASMIGGSIQASNICKEGKNWWYDIQAAKCRPCKECPSKAFMMEPCSNFMDAMCIDITELEKSIKESRSSGQEIMLQGPYKWHEMEGPDNKAPDVTTSHPFITVTTTRHIGEAMLYLGCLFIMVSMVLLVMYLKTGRKYPLRSVDVDIHPHNRFLSPRDKRIARDRFNTTEYMNNLATLDRCLAMDEILEKRKTIFEPPILVENVYVDEFIDLSSVIPRHQADKASTDEPEHKRCLLKIQDN